MGQSINEQAYPFELIKNKTLQFLAKSLPILKSEYETIPKVARYLSANQLLNPTSHQSTLGHEHFNRLNQNARPAPPFLRRRKRSSSGANQNKQQQQQQVSITMAELMPNATLVVSSAHSAGRVGHYQSRSADGQPFAMITKDGYRQISSSSRASANLEPMTASPSSNAVVGGHATSQQITVSSSSLQSKPRDHDAGAIKSKTSLRQQQQQPQVDENSTRNNGTQKREEQAQQHQSQPTSHGESSATTNHANGRLDGASKQPIEQLARQQQQQRQHDFNEQVDNRITSRSANNDPQMINAIHHGIGTTTNRNYATSGDNSHKDSTQLQARSSSTSGIGHQAGAGDSVGGNGNNAQQRTGQTGDHLQANSAPTVNGANTVVRAKSNSNSNSISSSGQQQQQHLKCSNVNGLLLYT